MRPKNSFIRGLSLCLALGLAACASGGNRGRGVQAGTDASIDSDAGTMDGDMMDAAPDGDIDDAGSLDAAMPDGDANAPDGSSSDAGSSDGGQHDGGPSDGGSADAGDGAAVDAGLPDVSPADALTYAHSETTLFSFDPRDNSVSVIGNFTYADGRPGQAALSDIAVNQRGHIYGCDSDSVYLVHPGTAKLTKWVSFTAPAGEPFNALTFVPQGALRAGYEALVGVTQDGQFYEIDLTTGQVTRLGQYSDDLVSAGDILSVEGKGTFALVHMGNIGSDFLTRINLSTGEATIVGATGFDGLDGLAYFDDTLYAFSNNGSVIRLNGFDGTGVVIRSGISGGMFVGGGVMTRPAP